MSQQTIATATIAINTSLSGAVNLANFRIVGIQMPSTWTAANLTFQAAVTVDGTYQDVYDSGGTEVSVTAAASRFISMLETQRLRGMRAIKVRSGTTSVAVNQAAARDIILILSDGD